jgi:tricarballylate dehydrogenase
VIFRAHEVSGAGQGLPRACDVLALGGGMAGFCAAIAARRAGATVVLVDAAPRWMQGGDTRHARNFRIVHDRAEWFAPDTYTADEFLADLRRVAGDAADSALAQRLVQGARDIAQWLAANGVLYQRAGDGLLPYSRRTAFFHGGGRAAMNALGETARKLGVIVAHEAEVCGLNFREDEAATVDVAINGAIARLTAKSVVACSGGAHADRDWLHRTFGAAGEKIIVRGAPQANGGVLRLLLAAGARAAGDPESAHFVAVDARAPASDGGIVTRVECIPEGIVVDRDGRRFADEGGDVARTHFSRWGERLLHAPDATAWLILDARGLSRASPMLLPPVAADGIAALADAIGVAAGALEKTVADFNAAARRDGQSEWRAPDLVPPKSRRAWPIATPPFAAVPMRPGITFARYGVAVDPDLRILRENGAVLRNAFAAGMIMAANVLPSGYLAGLAVCISAVSGRLAGEAAAAYSLQRHEQERDR